MLDILERDRVTAAMRERRRPSGKVLRFDVRPTSDGGCQVEVTDITALKLAEDEARRPPRCSTASWRRCRTASACMAHTILDPMMGSGTTGKMAVKYQRKFIGIDISAEYVEIAVKRIKEAQLQMRMDI